METNIFVPIENFGKDHWSMLAYIETVMVDYCGYTVSNDLRIRVSPKRGMHRPVVMTLKNSTRLKDGTIAPWHDDLSCLEDFAAAGMLNCTAEDIQQGFVVRLSDFGWTLVQQLRRHKASGGTFGNFDPTACVASNH